MSSHKEDSYEYKDLGLHCTALYLKRSYSLNIQFINVQGSMQPIA